MTVKGLCTEQQAYRFLPDERVLAVFLQFLLPFVLGESHWGQVAHVFSGWIAFLSHNQW